jgi:tetratricopeptide (TPR) repeat protein
LGFAQIALVAGHLHRALEYASKAAQISPEFLECNFLALKLRAAAAAGLIRQLSGIPNTPETHFLLAALYESAGDTSEASRQRAAADSALQVLGNRRQEGGQACEAEDYTRCIAFLTHRRSLDASQALNLGYASLVLGENTKASDAFGKALAQERGAVEALYWLVRADSSVASSYFLRLQKTFPNSPQSHEVRAETYVVQGQYGGAIKQYQLAEALEPDNAEIHRALGALYLKQNKPEPAADELRKSLELNPTDSETLYLLGRATIGLQKPEIAIACLEQALRYDPSLLKARASLGIAYLHAGKPALAAEQLEEAASLDHYGDLHYMLYQAYREMGKTELARNALAVSQAFRRKTAAAAQVRLESDEP